MAITNGYATLAQLKARLSVPTATTTHDTAFEAYIETASRQIDNDLDRQFYASSSETRYYTADDALTLFLPHDVLTVSEVALLSSAAGGVRIYGWTLTTDEYDLEPYDGPPYTRLSVGGTSRYTFPLQRRGVRITGTFGYCALANVPKPISEACLVYAGRLAERAKSPLGVIGGGDLTEAVRITKTDPDYQALIGGYKRAELFPTRSWGG